MFAVNADEIMAEEEQKGGRWNNCSRVPTQETIPGSYFKIKVRTVKKMV